MMAAEPNARREAADASCRSRLEMEDALNHVRHALRGLEYGEISIVVQDGVVIQIERTERTRIRQKKKMV
jgi:hypothetical protein